VVLTTRELNEGLTRKCEWPPEAKACWSSFIRIGDMLGEETRRGLLIFFLFTFLTSDERRIWFILHQKRGNRRGKRKVEQVKGSLFCVDVTPSVTLFFLIYVIYLPFSLEPHNGVIDLPSLNIDPRIIGFRESQLWHDGFNTGRWSFFN